MVVEGKKIWRRDSGRDSGGYVLRDDGLTSRGNSLAVGGVYRLIVNCGEFY